MKGSLVLSFCLAATPLSGAFAQSVQSFDVLGVQLGMPREMAVQLLQRLKPPYAVTNTNGLNVEDLGSSVWHTSLGRSSELTSDSIDLDFAPPPTASTVLRISRNVCYNCSVNHKTSPDAPSLDNFARGLAEKFKTMVPTVVVGRSQYAGTTIGETSVYVWTPAGDFLSAAELGRRLRYPARCTNPPQLDQARLNTGISFDLHLDDQNFAAACGTVLQIHWQQTGGIVTQFDMTFSDVAGLISAFAKSDALVRAKQGGQHQQQLQHANQNRPNL